MSKIMKHLITDGLGYCCPYAFFSLYRPTRLIVARLGVGRRTVQEWKLKMKEGELTCECTHKCLREKLPDMRVMLKIIREETAGASSSVAPNVPPNVPPSDCPKLP
jgi:hypothetical protein